MGLVGKAGGDRKAVNGKDAEAQGKEPAEQPEDPPAVKQLKELDDKYLKMEREYETEVQKLRVQFTAKQQPLLDERKKVLSTPAEGNGPKSGTPALAGFWLKALQNHPSFTDAIEEWDKPVLEYLTNIEEAWLDETDNNKGFKLTFHISENPYFTNTTLTKEYVTEETNPYSGEIEVKEIKSSRVDWKEGKDVTVEKVAKKAKGGKAKNRKAKATESIEPRSSFFRDFFRSLKSGEPLPADAKAQAMGLAAEEDDEDEDDDEALCEYLMENDHEVGSAVRDHIIPFAVRWYTGEAAPEGEDEDDEDEEDEEDQEEESSDDDIGAKGKGRGKASKAQAKKHAGGGGGGGKKASPELKPKETPKEECKQQ